MLATQFETIGARMLGLTVGRRVGKSFRNPVLKELLKRGSLTGLKSQLNVMIASTFDIVVGRHA